MKKIYTLLVGGLISTLGYAQQPDKLVLVEAFSNASCPPCAANNPQMNALLDNNTAKAISVKFQANFPGADPMNAQNPTENNNHRSFYGVTAVPGVMVDGVTGPINSGTINQGHIDAAYNLGTDIDVQVSHTISADFDSIFITATANNLGTSNLTGDIRLHVALIEREINFPEPPGSTNEQDFYNVMRKMYPNETGTVLTGGLSVGSPQTITFSEAIPSYIYNYGEIAVVAWVQNVASTSKQVYNAAYSAPLALPPGAVDAGLSNLPQNISNLCAEDFSPEVTLLNEGNEPITSAVISYSLNGGAPVDFNYTGNLAPNASETITFPSASLLAGQTNSLTFEITDVNNGAFDFNSMNNSTPTIEIPLLPVNPVPAPVMETFESTPNFNLPNDFIYSGDLNGVFVIDQNSVNGLNWSLGGFGASEKSLLVDFWAKPAGDETFITVPKIDMTSAPGSIVSFNYAQAPFNAGSNDYLAFEVSEDCGVTWDIVWQASGSDLGTVAPMSNARFFPQHSETQTVWRKIVIGLADYGSATELVCRFRAISDFGNSLWIDDINIASATASVQDVEESNIKSAFADVSVFPNPASTQFTVNMSSSEQINATISVVNTLGQTLYTTEETVNGERSIDVSTENMASGMYQIVITSGNERMVKKITVQK